MILLRLATLSAVFLLFIAIAYFYVVPATMGGICAILFYPTKQRIRRTTRLGTFMLTFLINGLFVIPFFLLLIYAAKNAFLELNDIKILFETKQPILDVVMTIKPIQKTLLWITERFPVSSAALTDSSIELLAATGQKLLHSIGDLVAHIPSIMMSLLVGMVSFYFFLRDGKQFVLFLEKHSCFNPVQTQHLFHAITQICKSVILAAFVSGIFQGLISMLICAITGMPNILLVGIAVFFGSFLPVVGCMPVMLIITLIALLKIGLHQAIVIFISGCLLLAIDSMIRPWFLRGSANLHPLLAFITALGGVHLLGFCGIFIGPIVAAIFVKMIYLLSEKDLKTS